jgi:CHAD domain-containing protein
MSEREETYDEYLDRKEQHDLDSALARIAEQAAEVERLRECLRIAGLQAFMRDRPPSEVAEHLRSVMASHVEAADKAESERDRLAADVAEWVKGHRVRGGGIAADRIQANALRRMVGLLPDDGYAHCPECGARMCMDQDELLCGNQRCPAPARDGREKP